LLNQITKGDYMKRQSSYQETLVMKKEILEKKIKRIDQQIEDALIKNDFLEAERLEEELFQLEQALLKTYTSFELENLFSEDYSA
jgi:excinuclease UvrABC helicase subunit UvrB